MKNYLKYLFSILIVLSINGIIDASSLTVNTPLISSIDLVCKFDQCHATAKSTGERCKHCVSNDGDTYCWQHK